MVNLLSENASYLDAARVEKTVGSMDFGEYFFHCDTSVPTGVVLEGRREGNKVIH